MNLTFDFLLQSWWGYPYHMAYSSTKFSSSQCTLHVWWRTKWLRLSVSLITSIFLQRPPCTLNTRGLPTIGQARVPSLSKIWRWDPWRDWWKGLKILQAWIICVLFRLLSLMGAFLQNVIFVDLDSIRHWCEESLVLFSWGTDRTLHLSWMAYLWPSKVAAQLELWGGPGAGSPLLCWLSSDLSRLQVEESQLMR